jgi:phosphoribosylanthranilate isomerase
MKVKICGITRPEDALFAAARGADALGFIFVKASPRFIDPDAAGLIIGQLPPFVTPVGVFVNEHRESILRTIARSGIRCLQMHGEESPGDTEGYAVPVIKSFRVGEAFDPELLAAYGTSACLLDTFVGGSHGGTGKTFDWRIALDAKRYARIILSGGLTPGNVTDAISTVQPYAIDLSSGVESAPGVKDHAKVRALFERIREAAGDLNA